MCFTIARWSLLLLCLLLTSCSETPLRPRKAKSATAKAADTQLKASSPEPSPLSVRIDLGSQTSEPTIEYEGPIRVVVTNHLDHSVRIWSPQKTKNGYHQFSFHFKNPKTGKEKIARRSDVEDQEYWKLLALESRHGAELVEIAAKGEASFEFYLSTFAWGERAWGGLPSPNSDQPYSVWVEFANADGSREHVWTGSVHSEPIAARFVANRLSTPHHYLWNGFAEKAIEVMESDPKWISRTDEDRCTPLHHAARFGPPEAVQWLLARGADVNAVAYNGFTPLHLADDPAIIRLILEKKPDLTIRNTIQGETARQEAASNLANARDGASRKRLQQIMKLYEGAGGEADLLTAITVGDLKRVKAILEKSPALADDFQDESPLRMAASRGHFEICKYLLDNFRVDVNDFERGTGYPIIKGALAHPKIVKLLIEHGADLKKRITWMGGRTGIWIIGDDATALHYAADDGVPETVTLLIENGVDIFATAHDIFNDKSEQTALEVAAYFGKADNAEAIINHPKFDLAEPENKQALLDKCLRLGANPSWLAREANRPKLMEVLIRKGANPNTSIDGVTSIQIAARDIHPTHPDENDDIKQTIAVLTKHGAKMDLFSAVAIGDERQVQALLANDPKSANARGPDGYPALHFAVGMNYKSIVAALLKAGGDVNIPNKSENTGGVGETALDCAEFWERDEIAKLLIDAGGKHQTEMKSTEPAPSSTKSP
ncbi:MAG: ankyrin repeat domain-containing protein [Pirellulaceae bacterium]